MVFKLRSRCKGDTPHVQVSVYAGPDAEHLAHIGDLWFRAHEWKAFREFLSGSTDHVILYESIS